MGQGIHITPSHGYCILPDANLLILKVIGHFTTMDFSRWLEEALSNPLYRPRMNEILDFSLARFVGGFDNVLQYKDSLVDSDFETRGPFRIAVVAPHDSMFGSANMFVAMAGCFKVKVSVFRSIIPVLPWLELEEYAEEVFGCIDTLEAGSPSSRPSVVPTRSV